MKHKHPPHNEESVLIQEEQIGLEKLCIPNLDYSNWTSRQIWKSWIISSYPFLRTDIQQNTEIDS